MNKKSLTETDIRTKFITPALTGTQGEKWNVMTQIREEAHFTKGRVIVRRLNGTEYENTIRDLLGMPSRPIKSGIVRMHCGSCP